MDEKRYDEYGEAGGAILFFTTWDGFLYRGATGRTWWVHTAGGCVMSVGEALGSNGGFRERLLIMSERAMLWWWFGDEVS